MNDYTDKDRILARELARALLTVVAALRDRYDLPTPREAPRTDMEARMMSKAAMLDAAAASNGTKD